MTLTRGFVRNAQTTPQDVRLMDMATVVPNADGSPRTGVLGMVTGALLTALGTMAVAINAAEFVTSRAKAQGVTIFTNDGVVNVTIAAAPASNSRIDLIYVKHNDDTAGDPNALPVFGVVTGAAAAVPTKPALPTGAEELGTLRVYAGTTAANGGSNTLTETYKMTAMRGGVVPFRTKADLDVWTNPTLGQMALVLGPSPLNYQWSGTAWVVQGGGLVLLAKSSFAGATQVILDSVFSSLFTNYLLRVNIRSTSAGTGVAFQMRAGGSNAQGSPDYRSVSRTNSGTSITGATAGEGSGPLTKGTIAALYAEMRLFDPALASRTVALIDSHGVGSASAAEMGTLGVQHNPAVAYDGIRLLTGGVQTLTGEVSVYGLA